MTSWKAKIYDVMRKIDNLDTAEKDKMLMNIQDLNVLMDDMGRRVEQLRTECPSDWSPIKKEDTLKRWLMMRADAKYERLFIVTQRMKMNLSKKSENTANGR